MKMNIDTAVIKRNLDLIIAGIVTVALVGYGYMQYGATKTIRDESASKLESNTRNYKNVKSTSVPESFGLTNVTSISTDRAHGNQEIANKAEVAINAHLNNVYKKFAELEIPDGIEVDPKTGAILSVTLMNGGNSYTASDIGTLTATVTDRLNKGKGAILKPELRSVGGDTPEQYRVENIAVQDGGSGYTKGQVIVLIGGAGGAGGGFDGSNDYSSDSQSIPNPTQPPGGMPGGMPGMMGMGSMGAGGDDSKARVGIDDNTFLKFMHTKVYGLQRQCKIQRIRLPKFEEESKEFRFSFSKSWNQPEFEPHEREIMCYQLAEIEALCQALFKANVHEIYNVRRLKVVRGGDGAEPSEEDMLEFFSEQKFTLDDVTKFKEQVPGARVMPYEITFRGFSSEVSKVLEELYKSKVFFVVKNIAVIEATGVVDDFEEEEEDEMTLGGGGVAARSMREAYGGRGGRGGMRGGYGTMPFGMGMGGFGFGGEEEKKRRRPPSLLMDESPLKVTLRVNTIKRVDPIKDESDAISALQNQVAEAERKAEEGGESDDDLIGVDEDGDGFDAYDEKITGHSDDDPEDKPTQEEVDAAQAKIDAGE